MEPVNKNNEDVISQRTEEVQHIIERMPQHFGRVITIVVLTIFLLLLFFGWVIRYPDVATGQISISASHPPVKLIAPQSGKIQLSDLRSQDRVAEGQIIAWFENPALLDDVIRVSNILDSITLPTGNAHEWYNKMPKNMVLGDLTPKYFTFLNAIKQLGDYQYNRLYDKQHLALEALLLEQKHVLEANQNKEAISHENLDLINRLGEREATLHQRNVLSDADMDRSKLNAIGAKDLHEGAIRDVATAREQISRTQNQMQELRIQQSERVQQLDLELLTAYNDFRDNLTSWRQRYLFRAPFNGKVQFLDFWRNNQFVQTGEPVFTVVPEHDQPIGHVVLPAFGAGKVETGQEAIVKLDDYPFMEYGSITGYVETISLTTNAVNVQQGEIETYLVTVRFPNQLETNYGGKLEFRHELKGTAEIVTHDRRLIQRFFDNLRYIMKK